MTQATLDQKIVEQVGEDVARVIVQKIGDFRQLDGLEIEVIGYYIWLGGNTREHKEELKDSGCIWHSKKMRWTWVPKGLRRTKGRGSGTDINRIRGRHGSVLVDAA